MRKRERMFLPASFNNHHSRLPSFRINLFLLLTIAAVLASWVSPSVAQTTSYRIQDAGFSRQFELSLDEIAVTKADRKRVFTKIDPATSAQDLKARITTRSRTSGEKIEYVVYEIEKGQRIGLPRVVTFEVLFSVSAQTDAEAAGHQAGALAVKPAEAAPRFWIATARDSDDALRLAEALRNISGVLSADPLLARLQSKKLIPTDAFFPNQWHLVNTGQFAGVSGVDVRITNVWDTYRGTNIQIAIIDDGLEVAHPDLAPNVNTLIDYDINYNDGDPSPDVPDDNHGTACAGVAAAAANNTTNKVVGAAPEARLVGLRLISAATTDAEEAQAINWSNSIIHIKSNSWGPADDGETLAGPGPLTSAAFSNACATGRGGKGSLIFWAGGNGLDYGDDSNLDGYANSIYSIAIAAVSCAGTQSWYSEPGANIVVSAPSSGDNRTLSADVGIWTVDRTGADGYNDGASPGEPSDANVTATFGGTSSATPLAAGISALIVQANTNLGWRDVQEILLRTATKVAPTDPAWTTNGAGLNINHKYGGGMINASGAVARALTWTNLGPQTIFTTNQTGFTTVIPDNNPAGITRTFTMNRYMRLEHVVATVDIAHERRRNLRIELVSPANTTSVLATADSLLTFGADFPNWPFMTIRNWGESALGTWTLRIADRVGGTLGTNTSAGLTFYGTVISNTPPLMDPVESRTVGLGSAVSFDVIANDLIDEDAITLSATGLPPGAQFATTSAVGTVTGNFIWNNAAPTGTYSISFLASDNDGVTTQTVTLAVRISDTYLETFDTTPNWIGDNAFNVFGLKRYSNNAALPVGDYFEANSATRDTVNGVTSNAWFLGSTTTSNTYLRYVADTNIVNFSVALARFSASPDLAFKIRYSVNSGASYTDLLVTNGSYFTADKTYKTFNSGPLNIGPVVSNQVFIEVLRISGARMLVDNFSVEYSLIGGANYVETPPSLTITPPPPVEQGAPFQWGIQAVATDGDPVELSISNAPAGSIFSSTGASGALAWYTAGPAGSYTAMVYAADKDGVASAPLVINVSTSPQPRRFVGGYRVRQFEPQLDFTLPASTLIATNGSIIIARNAGLSAFQTFWGVTLGSNVTFINAADAFPDINGAETYSLFGVTNNLIEGPSASPLIAGYSVQRISVINTTDAANWTQLVWSAASPGANTAAGTLAALAITEYADVEGVDNQIYEFVELSLGTGSNNLAGSDTDGDGLLDAWEIANFGNLTSANGSSDVDGDGFIDLHEFLAGTIPTNSASYLRINSATPQAGSSNVVVQWPGVTGKFYRVSMTTNLTGGIYTNLATGVAGAPLNVITASPPAQNVHIYRIELEQ